MGEVLLADLCCQQILLAHWVRLMPPYWMCLHCLLHHFQTQGKACHTDSRQAKCPETRAAVLLRSARTNSDVSVFVPDFVRPFAANRNAADWDQSDLPSPQGSEAEDAPNFFEHFTAEKIQKNMRIWFGLTWRLQQNGDHSKPDFDFA